MQKAGAGGRAKKNIARDFQIIATKSADFPEPYIAKIRLGQGAGHPPVEVYFHLCLPHEALYHLITKRSMDVKHANCDEARVDQRLGGHETTVLTKKRIQ